MKQNLDLENNIPIEFIEQYINTIENNIQRNEYCIVIKDIIGAWKEKENNQVAKLVKKKRRVLRIRGIITIAVILFALIYLIVVLVRKIVW